MESCSDAGRVAIHGKLPFWVRGEDDGDDDEKLCWRVMRGLGHSVLGRRHGPAAQRMNSNEIR